MDWKPEIKRQLRELKLDPAREAAIIEELSQHLDDCYAELIDGGVAPADAHRQTLAELSGSELLTRELRRVERQVALEPIVLGTNRRRNMLADMWQDLRYGARVLVKNRVFTLIAVITLALGIGANTAIFSVINAVLLRSLPYEHSEQLVMVYARTKNENRALVAWPELRDWQAQSQSFTELATFVPQSVNLTGLAEPGRIVGGFVSANFFDLLKVKAAMGRTFARGEDETGAERIAIVNHLLWREHFGADPELIGRAITLNGQLYTVIGIMPEGFRSPYSEIDVWVPIQHHPAFSAARNTPTLEVIGRLKPDVTMPRAQAEMETIAARLARQYPETNAERSVNLIGLQSILVESVRTRLWVLFAAVGFVLLIGCANVANLTLSRAVTRTREIAVRVALGASRARIVSQLLTESLLLALLGGSLGLLLGKWGMDLLAANSVGNLPPGVTFNLDAWVFGFTFGISLLTGVLCGWLPALRLSRPDLNTALKEGGRAAGTGPSGSRARDLLVVAQVALALMLLVGAGLLVRSFANLMRIDPGFKPQNLLTLEYRLPQNKYPEPQQQWRFHDQVVANVQSLPGVESAAVFFTVPHGANIGTSGFALPDRDALPADQLPRAQVNRAHANYFQTMGIPLLKGRVFTAQDQPNTPPAIVINQTLARRFWPGEDPVGKLVELQSPRITAAVIGVVGDVKHNSIDEPDAPQIYLSFAQNPHIFASLAVRTTNDPLSFSNAVRNAIWAIDKDQPVWKVRTMEFLLEREVSSSRFIVRLLGALALLALVLAAVGIYGVLSYTVSQQTRDIGVRLALGAQPSDILRLVLKRGLVLALSGIAIGLALSLGLTRLISGLLYGVTANDPLTFVAIALLLTFVALVACYIPARRATKVNPLAELRGD
jgi:putative ABC transport system permease protein